MIEQVTGGSDPHQWYPEPAPTSPPNRGGPIPALTINGAQLEGKSTPPEVTQPWHSTPNVHVDATHDEDDEDTGSLEDTTGSLTSVD